VTSDAHASEAPWYLRRRVGTGLFMVLYAVILQLSYARLIAPVFGYLGQTYRSPSPISTVIAVMVTVILSIALPTRVRRTSDFVLWTCFLIAVAPSILIAQYADVLSIGRALTTSLWIGAIFLVTVWAARWALPRFRLHIGLPPYLITLMAAAFTILFTGYLVASAGASFQVVALDAVQDVRSSYKGLLETSPFVGYALQLQTAVLNPIFMAVGVVRRRPAVLLAGVVGQVLIYSVTGYKLTILSPVFVILLAYYLTKVRRLSGFALTAGITASMTLALVLDSITGGRFFVTIFINRLMAAPGVLTAAYFKVFDGQPKYIWSHSFLSSFIRPPYDLTPGYYVGRAFQGVDSQANVNLFGDGYANLGMLGICIEAAFLLVVLALLDAAARNVPFAIAAPSTMVAALGLANNSSFTSVLTGGMGGLILAFALWPRAATAEPTEPALGDEATPAPRRAGAERSTLADQPSPASGRPARR
jgi:hypothetical protein